MGGGNSAGSTKHNKVVTIRSNENINETEGLKKALEKISELEETFSSYQHSSKITKSLLFFKDIDFIETLDAIVYKLEITSEFWDIESVITKIENGFSKLKCMHSICQQNAIMYVKTDEDTQAQLYWEGHLRLVDAPDDVQYFLDEELEEDIEILESLGKLLMILPGQMECITNEDASKHYQAFKIVKNQIDYEFKSLRKKPLKKLQQRQIEFMNLKLRVIKLHNMNHFHS